MRAAHYCTACERQLPLCVRSDRQFCSSRCRVWAFRHPGQKRPDYARGRVRLPQRPGQGQPKTLAAALVALSDARKYAAKLEATARAQNTEEQKLLTEMGKLREGLLEVRRELAAERDDRAKTKEKLGKTEDEKNTKTKENYQRLRQIERLLKRLKRTETDVKKKQAELDRVQADFSKVRDGQERKRAEQERMLRDARAQLAELARERDELMAQIKTLIAEVERLRSREDLARIRDELVAQINALTARAEELKEEVEQAEQDLKKHEEEVAGTQKPSDDDKHGPGQPRSLVELLQRRLEDEQARRIAAEQRIAELLSEVGNPKKAREPDAVTPSGPPPIAPGQYQRHATAAGYDFTRDPLLALMRRDVLVADRYADWQAKHMKRLTSRRRDPEQTLDEQAYAAAVAARWRLMDHPHLRLGVRPMWSLLGYLLDENSERYLLTITQERIDEMQSRMAGRLSVSS